MYDVLGKAPDAFTEGQFIYYYMSISNYAAQSHADDNNTGLVEMAAVPGNSIAELTPVNWVYDMLWYADGFELAPNAEPVYKMGPSGYMFDYLYCGLLNTVGNSYILTYAVESARFNTLEMGEEVFTEGIEFFKSLSAIYESADHNFTIENIYPNPTSNKSTLVYNLNDKADVSIRLTDITGKEIFNSQLGLQYAGTHEYTISSESLDLNNGLYLVSIKINNNTFTGKIVINK
jgi:hypothetical protein